MKEYLHQFELHSLIVRILRVRGVVLARNSFSIHHAMYVTLADE